MMNKAKIIGIAEMYVDKAPGVITTLGLGSCIGITLYDPKRKVGGMVHIMLPTSSSPAEKNKAKFADSGAISLLEEMQKNGAVKGDIVAKIAGGAHMFSNASKSDVIKVGQRNVIAVRGVLRSLGIPIVADDTGGTYGRTIEFHTDDGKLIVKTIGHGTKSI